MTTWTAQNTYECDVFDVERNRKILLVHEADDETGVLTCFYDPTKVDKLEFLTYKVQCRSIVPVYGGFFMPQMLLCFGVKELS